VFLLPLSFTFSSFRNEGINSLVLFSLLEGWAVAANLLELHCCLLQSSYSVDNLVHVLFIYILLFGFKVPNKAM